MAPQFPGRRTDPFHPPAELAVGPPARVRLRNGSEHWLISRLDEARDVLTDPRFSADDQHPGFPRAFPLPPEPGALSFLRMDDPEHGRLRRVLTTEFTVRRINAMRPAIERMVDDLLDGLEPPVDLVSRFAFPLPSLVICDLLGVPYADHDFFQERSMASLSLVLSKEETAAALADLGEYLSRLVRDKVRRPTDDLLGRVAERRVITGELTEDELAVMARLLLVAGHETTANLLAFGTLSLLRHPAQLAALRADPALVRPAVEELLRHLTITHLGLPRVALEPVDVGDVRVSAGEGVLVYLSSANRDADHFEEPDALNIHRPPVHHVAFGYGMHQCIGQTLARVELDVAFARLFARFPDLRLDCDVSDIRFRDGEFVYGVHALPVTW
ncbi:cytochrome P450 [Actinomadura rubrisoli]|uniref:Cytochrome P450 n=1 Tax=Actinomadura rubrisoli TaxID=2530368 RepID=A0A4R5B5M2_9ACTN|nr:cytochrome P450 [Actinomadura rubrisoli]TDD79666.1 cytochrome P450 [Actinomadura rubrisoli]